MADGIKISNVSRYYKLNDLKIGALRDVSHFIRAGSFCVLVGKSGCGKTTLLRVLAGLESPDSGDISFLRSGEFFSKDKFRIGMVFQEPRLMPWLTVEENIAFGIKGVVSAADLNERVAGLLDLLGLSDFKNAYPSQISGGMAQRTALGRTLAFEPDIVLMDEPFGALDYFTRRNLQEEIIRIHRSMGKTFVFVTHDVEEAIALGQEVILMREGRIIRKIDLPFDQPRDIGGVDFQPFRKMILKTLSQ